MQQALGLVHRLVGLVRWLKTHSVGGGVAHIAARFPAVGVAKKKVEGQTTCPALRKKRDSLTHTNSTNKTTNPHRI